MKSTLAALCLLFVATHSIAAEQDGLIAHWSFDATESRLVLDQSPRHNDAMAVNARLVKGVHQAAVQFNGRSTSVQCLDVPDLNLTSAMTLEAWIQLHDLPAAGFPSVIRKSDSYALRFSGKRLGFLIWSNSRIVTLTAPELDWKYDRWYHVAATYDREFMKMYIDGNEVAQLQVGSIPIDVSPTSLGIGSDGTQHLLSGIVDEVRLFNRALDASAIRESYRRGLKSLEDEKDVVIASREVGRRTIDLRKPPRESIKSVEGTLWIDAEDFADYGGWSVDTQFTHLMGSAYLIAAGTGTPVKNAEVDINLEQSGAYRLFVRAKDWLPSHSPGQFTVAVNGRTAKPILGVAKTDQWQWVPAGTFELAKGTVRLELHDLTGYYGRCDAIVLTRDTDYVPPDDVDAILKERSRLTGVSLEPQDGGQFDVIVVGAGAAGSCAAIASARMGMRTALIQNRPVLGGNASDELGVGISGASCCHRNARESGIIEEAGRIKARFAFPRMSEPFRMLCEAEPLLTTFMNEHVFDVEMADATHIAGVQSRNTLTGQVTVYHAPIFLDCTGDGWVGYFAKADYRMGREARDEFNESLAPETADDITMSGCLMGGLALSYRAERTSKPVVYTPPPWAAQLPDAAHFGRRPKGFTSGQWWLEHPGTIDDLWDAEKARDELIRISYGYWNYIKNEWPDRKQAERYTLTFVPITDAKRESRRLLGDHILTQNDVLDAVPFPDRIAYGGWPLDIHHPEGIYSGEAGPFDYDTRTPIYTIPYRCLYSRNIENLLFAGRNASTTHVALGTIRVQGTLALLGQAAGTAAALCVQYRTTPRFLGRDYITLLQQTLLRDDQYIPGVANHDPDDLARQAKITASSTAAYDPFEKDEIQLTEDVHPLNMPRAVLFPRGLNGQLASVSLWLQSHSTTAHEVTLHVRQAAESADFSATDDVAVVHATVPAEYDDFIAFPVQCKITSPFVWVWVEPVEDVQWRLMRRAPTGSCRAYGGRPQWTVVPGQHYAFLTEPALQIAADYAPQNIINGITRFVDRTPNLWVSDPTTKLPAWIQLDFGEPVEVNTVQLTFDTDMNERRWTTALVPQCVRDYDIACRDGKTWRTLVTARGNFQRHRVHRFERVKTSQLRLTIHATNGDRCARIFEIRAYNKSDR